MEDPSDIWPIRTDIRENKHSECAKVSNLGKWCCTARGDLRVSGVCVCAYLPHWPQCSCLHTSLSDFKCECVSRWSISTSPQRPHSCWFKLFALHLVDYLWWWSSPLGWEEKRCELAAGTLLHFWISSPTPSHPQVKSSRPTIFCLHFSSHLPCSAAVIHVHMDPQVFVWCSAWMDAVTSTLTHACLQCKCCVSAGSVAALTVD